MRPGRAADHSPPSSAAVMEEYSYNSTHTLGHTGPVIGSHYFYLYLYLLLCTDISITRRYTASLSERLDNSVNSCQLVLEC